MHIKAVAAVVGSNLAMHIHTESILLQRFGIAYYPVTTYNDLTINILEHLADIGIDFLIIDTAAGAGSLLIHDICTSSILKTIKVIYLDSRIDNIDHILTHEVRCFLSSKSQDWRNPAATSVSAFS